MWSVECGQWNGGSGVGSVAFGVYSVEWDVVCNVHSSD